MNQERTVTTPGSACGCAGRSCGGGRSVPARCTCGTSTTAGTP